MNVNCNMFIVPNPATKKSDYRSELASLDLKDRLNGVTDNSMYVHCWLTNDKSSDFGSHGFQLPDGSYAEYCGLIDYVPLSLLEGHVEGDVINYMVIVSGDRIVNLHCKLTQRGYRYSHFGNFEDALKTVIKRGEEVYSNLN